ncbi:DEAD/DEAH box helicase [Bdellovibrionota bacterium FG-1]
MQLRPFQKEALTALSQPGHVLCIAPTGSGKSLIYERAAVQSGRKTLLISPLVALARQQQARLKDLPLAGAQDQIRIISPESLLNPARIRALRHWRPNFLVVDECHCLWEWGESFRPAFNEIPKLMTAFSIQSSLWLTATLPPEARLDLRTRLPGPLIELGAFNLPPHLQITLKRIPWSDRASVLVTWILQQKSAGIVFVSTREATTRVTRLLEAAKLSVVSYHAGLSQDERRNIEQQITLRQVQIIVATSAFGMGMDHAHLRWVALWQAPHSLLTFAQAIGRAGRDRGCNPKDAHNPQALVLWDYDDFRLLDWSVRKSERQQAQLLQVSQYLESPGCRRVNLRQYFEVTPAGVDHAPFRCGACDFCVAAETFAQF